MSKRISEGAFISLLSLGAGLLSAGCAGSDVSVGDESGAVNLGRCYGDSTRCVASKQATIGVETAIQDCPEEQVGVLEVDESYLVTPSNSNGWGFEVAEDGSVWTLSGGSQESAIVSHWSAEGTLLGVSEPLATPSEHTTYRYDLAVNGEGHAVVSVYSVYAATADDPLTERLVIHTLDAAAQPAREPLAFRGSGDSVVGGGPGDSFILGGDARDNATHGVLARVTAGEPDWIQTAVPSAGAGAGVGVADMTLASNGESSVLAQRNPRWEPGAPDTYSYGVARFDDSGNLLWDLLLPTAYAGGWLANIASTPAGDLVVRGKLPAADPGQEKILIRQVTRLGQVGWAFRTTAGIDDSLGVDDSGRTIANSSNSVVVISADGQSCKQYGLPPSSSGFRLPAGLIVSGAWIYSAQDGGVRRYRPPAE